MTDTDVKPAVKPAAKGKKPATGKAKPATKKPADKGIGIAEVAKKLNMTPKSLRAAIRRKRGGAQVGKGQQYRWTSFADKDLVKLMKELKTN